MTHFAYRMARKMDPTAGWGAEPLREVFARQRSGVVARQRRAASESLDWKRVVDVVLSVVALILVSPIMLVAALLIKLTSRGPVIFKQERVGLDRRRSEKHESAASLGVDHREMDRRKLVNFGRPFTIYKFRTMVTGAENGQPMWAKNKDHRVTAVGRILRKTRVDELPQFINVLNGDMSIVGPRPERAYFIGQVEREIPDFQLRLRAKPGITGLAQVELGYTNTEEGLKEKLRFDLEYIRSLSFWTDFKILFKTIFVVLTGKGAC